ncbi:chorismate lyase [Thaumasiovibrio subtropicus]|uniref:chorismate lyase n=1 Tax=Thaumasiovibrio subtropicus TaxID=1891207 RepID=UPI000B35A4D1|nr:chorismate lyase [Thaumasiovibrio subtropicus]
MSEFKRLYKPLLEQAVWSPPTMFEQRCQIGDWLLDTTSLSRRFQQHCRMLSVELVEQTDIPHDALSAQEQQLLPQSGCLLRKVVLKGDGVPWLLGRTLIPHSTLTDEEQDLAQLGEMPLGLRVFQGEQAHRDALAIAQVGEGLWARRSRLWLNEKPMLVSEVFLADAPLYRSKDTWK